MWLLDIISPGNVHHHRILPPGIQEADTITTLPSDSVLKDTTACDTIASIDMTGSSQQLADIAPYPPSFLGLEGNEILWTCLVVLVALSLCFYFVKKYRRQQQ